MKIRNGFVSNSSSSSFVITDTNNFEKAKELLSDCYCGNYKVYKDVMYTSMISDSNDNYTEFFKISSNQHDGDSYSPYNDEDFILIEGENGGDEVPIPIEGLSDVDLIELGAAPYNISSEIYLKVKTFFEEESSEPYTIRVNRLIDEIREIGGWYED